jgi:hypothetical protein
LKIIEAIVECLLQLWAKLPLKPKAAILSKLDPLSALHENSSVDMSTIVPIACPAVIVSPWRQHFVQLHQEYIQYREAINHHFQIDESQENSNKPLKNQELFKFQKSRNKVSEIFQRDVCIICGD